MDTARDGSQHQTVQGGTYNSKERVVLRIQDGPRFYTLKMYQFRLPLLVYHSSKFAGLEVTWFPYSNTRVPEWSTNASHRLSDIFER